MARNSELNLRAAYALGKIGLRIFPASATTRIPCVKGWQEKATSDPDAIDLFWISFPKAVPAITTGGNDLLVVDLDVKKGKNGMWEWDAIFRENNFDWSGCPLVRTTTGGLHIYFRQREGELIGCSVGSVASGIDLRGIGGYVIAPDAVLDNGLTYHLVRGDMASIPTLPGDIHSFLASRLNSNKRGKVPTPTISTCNRSPPLTRNGDVKSRLAGLIRKVALAREGERNAILHWAGCRTGELVGAGFIQVEAAVALLTEAGRQAGLSVREAAATARSGIRTGSAGASHGR